MAQAEQSIEVGKSRRAAAAAGDGAFSTGKLSGVIYERILALIVSGDFGLNHRLPSEIELARKLGASRPVVREALARLRDDGVVMSRQGSGSYVVRQPDFAMLKLAPVGSVAEIQRCFEFRADLESAAAAVAAERRKPGDIEALDAIYEALETCTREGRLGVDEDIRLHEAVAAATHNPYYAATQASLREHIARGMSVMRNLSLRRSITRLRLVQAEHLALIRAIKEGDPRAARVAMETHIINARRRMFDGRAVNGDTDDD
jgi:DNA-binding FadR family transcriptional regulator